jgi:two-component system, NtrC family, sensor histidine kinase HupT/HoxJ
MHGLHGALSQMDRPEAHELHPAVDDTAWLAVIGKMDEVYSQLVADEIELEHKNAELEEQQRFILGLLTAMSDVLVACNDGGDIEETNKALCALVGRPHSDLRGTAVHTLLADPEERTKLDATLMRCRLGGQATEGENVELDILDGRGQRLPVDFNCSARRDAAGQRIGFVLIGRPLGELKRAYRQLRESHAALKQAQQQLVHSEKMASLGRLVAGVAHELNNPISFVLGNVQALRRYGERLQRYFEAEAGTTVPAERQRLREQFRIDAVLADLPSLIDGMSEGAERTAGIVDGLKRFSVVDLDERTLLDLRDVVDRAIHWIRKGSAPGFVVRWSPPAAPCQVRGSAGQLLQVVMNLIQNAADACRSLPEGALQITLQAGAGARWMLVFDDNGPGIPPEHLGRIFDPFFTTKPVGQGTGLGLSISHGIVERHGGVLSAAAAPVAGARFVIELPAVLDAAER